MLILSRFFLFHYFHGYKKPYKDTFFAFYSKKNLGYIWWKRIFIVPLQPQIRNSGGVYEARTRDPMRDRHVF